MQRNYDHRCAAFTDRTYPKMPHNKCRLVVFVFRCRNKIALAYLSRETYKWPIDNNSWRQLRSTSTDLLTYLQRLVTTLSTSLHLVILHFSFFQRLKKHRCSQSFIALCLTLIITCRLKLRLRQANFVIYNNHHHHRRNNNTRKNIGTIKALQQFSMLFLSVIRMPITYITIVLTTTAVFCQNLWI